MARRISSGGSRSFSGGRSRGSSFKSSGSRSSGGFKSSGFKPRTSYNYGGYRRHYRPYRRNYFFHSLGPTGKIVYIIFVIILALLYIAMGG